jgi:hypothetical protein
MYTNLLLSIIHICWEGTRIYGLMLFSRDIVKTNFHLVMFLHFILYMLVIHYIPSSCDQAKLSQMEEEYQTCVKKVEYQVIVGLEVQIIYVLTVIFIDEVLQFEQLSKMCTDKCFSRQLDYKYFR